MGALDDLHARVDDRMSRSAFEDAVTAVRERFHDLLDEEACALYVVAREGRLEPTDEDELRPGREVTLEGIVHTVHDLRRFKRGDGTEGRVLNVDVSTDRGLVRLVFWDDDASDQRSLQTGERVRIQDGFVKDGRYGLEVHLGRHGRLERLGEDDGPAIERGRTSAPGSRPTRDISGVLEDREATRTFTRDGGETGFVASVTVEADGDRREVTLWDEAVRQIQRVPLGQPVELRALEERDGELHSTSRTEIRAPDADETISLDAFTDA